MSFVILPWNNHLLKSRIEYSISNGHKTLGIDNIQSDGSIRSDFIDFVSRYEYFLSFNIAYFWGSFWIPASDLLHVEFKTFFFQVKQVVTLAKLKFSSALLRRLRC